jgi:hypothetical protein
MNQRISSIFAYVGSVAAATLAAALMSGNAFAEGPLEASPPFTSSMSRAEARWQVRVERPELTSYASEWSLQQDAHRFAPAATRSEMRADYIASRDQVLLANAEHGGSGYFARTVPMHPHAMAIAARDLR